MEMKLYFNPRSRSVTIDWLLKELDVEHEKVFINFDNHDKHLNELHSINPMKKLPTLVDGDIVITETAAICAYLADKFSLKKLAPEIGSVERGTYYRYMFIAGNTLEPALSLNSVGMEYPDPYSVGWGDMTRVLATIEQLTPEHAWILGEQFSAADIVFGGLLDFSAKFGWITPSPKINAYISRLRRRPCYLQAHPEMLGQAGGVRLDLSEA